MNVRDHISLLRWSHELLCLGITWAVVDAASIAQIHDIDRRSCNAFSPQRERCGRWSKSDRANSGDVAVSSFDD